jgi:hypothetical protein
VAVRPKEAPLIAVRVTKPTRVVLPDHETTAQPGECLVTRGSQIIRLLSAEQLAKEYDLVVPGVLTLSRADCHAIEETLGLGATESVPTLLSAIARLASVRIGDIRIPFTPGQLLELQHRAKKRGRTVEAEMKAVVARIEDELFYKGG